MPDYELSYVHNGRERVAVIYADGFRDAYEALESLRQTAVVSDEIIAIIPLAYEEKENEFG